jgi:hypothetical protein
LIISPKKKKKKLRKETALRFLELLENFKLRFNLCNEKVKDKRGSMAGRNAQYVVTESKLTVIFLVA